MRSGAWLLGGLPRCDMPRPLASIGELGSCTVSYVYFTFDTKETSNVATQASQDPAVRGSSLLLGFPQTDFCEDYGQLNFGMELHRNLREEVKGYLLLLLAKVYFSRGATQPFFGL